MPNLLSNRHFLDVIQWVENVVAKVLSLAMILVIIVALADLTILVVQNLFSPPENYLRKDLIEIFGLFLSVLIALEILENITAYLRRHVIQVELVIATSLTAVARKIIILDFDKVSGVDVIGLAIAIVALAVSYGIVRSMNTKRQPPEPPES
jgi:uncharacterized membrane protein (DUF373 family)